MANQWFRMYHEFATDPKVQMLSETDQRRYVMLLCLRCSNDGVTLHETEVAFQLRISNEELAITKANLMAKGLVDEGLQPIAWDKRQYASDSSAARVARHREKKKQACNVTVTPPDTDTDTDTDTDINPSSAPKDDGDENFPSDGVKASPVDFDLAEFILAGVRRLKPDLKNPNLNTWASDCRKIRELDGRTPRRIAEVFRWANQHDFWQTNILSPAKLRKQFDALELKMNQTPPSGGHGGNREPINNGDTSWYDGLDRETLRALEGDQAGMESGVQHAGGAECGEAGVDHGPGSGGYPRLVNHRSGTC